MSRTSSLLVAATLVFAVSCARTRTPAASGPATVARDQEEIDREFLEYSEAMTRDCNGPDVGSRSVVTALATVRGTVKGQSVSGRVWIGADYQNRSLRVESEAAPGFVLTVERPVLQEEMTDGEGTLYLPGQQRIVRRANTRALLETVLGVPLSADEFVAVFTGCSRLSGDLDVSTRGTSEVRIPIGHTGDVFLRRASPRSRWTLFAIGHEAQGGAFRWRAEYRRERNDVLRSIRIFSEEANRAPGRLFDLRLSLTRIQFAPLLVADTFSPTVPSETRSVSMEMVQQGGSRASLPLLTGVR
jgi:hypothetical protein